MDSFLQQVRQTLQDFRMLDLGHTVLVAVSGGADSIVLLEALARLRKPLALKLIVAHLNHQMRPDAADDAAFVETIACERGIRYCCDTIDVPAYQRQHKLSAEDAARQVRYAFLYATAARLEADRIAVGHTANDQAETVLLHLLRGSGLRGLGGMPPVHGRIIRPLIRLSRDDILRQARTYQLPFREDSSNRQRRYTRNRLRLDLLPALQEQYNPKLVQALCTTAQLLADDETALQMVAQQRFLVARLPAPEGQIHLATEVLSSLPIALQRRVVREALRQLLGGLQGVTQPHTAAILALLKPGTGTKWLRLPQGVRAEYRYNTLLIHREALIATIDGEIPLPIPGVGYLGALGVSIVSDVLGHETTIAPFPTGDVTWLDADRVGHKVYVRLRRPGDRLQPLGSTFTKKLKTFLIDAKIPRSLRHHLPLVVTDAGIAWVAGVRPAEWAKVTPATRMILRLRLIRHSAAHA